MKLSAYSLRLLPIALTLSFAACNPDKSGETKKPKSETADAVEKDSATPPDSSALYYGQTINKFLDQVDTFRVAKNSVFTNLFDRYQTDDSLLFSAIDKTDTIFRINRIIAGRRVNMIYREEDGVKLASHLIYHANETEKLVLGFRDSAYATWHRLPVDTVERTICARIENTLYHSILNANVSYELGIKLADVFAWQVNFFRIDKNDFFKVVFDEYKADGKTVEVGEVKAALFYHRGDSFYAFQYDQEPDIGYFDENGQNLKKAFLKAPLKYSRISSRFSRRRFHPVQKRWKAHLGTDYAAPTGTPIRTVGDGRIVAASYSRGNGRYVKVKHNSTYTTQYLHMSRIAKGIRNGKYVKQGEIIGYVGSTGLATGPHLCFRFWKNGVQVDPFTIKAPPTTPVSEKNMDSYRRITGGKMESLSAMELPPAQSDTTSNAN